MTSQVATTNGEARACIARIAKSLIQIHRAEIESQKEHGLQQWNRPDWLWWALLLSFSTMGNARGARLIRDNTLYQLVTYDALSKLSDTDRERVQSETLHKASVRMPDKKAAWLRENCRIIAEMGGPELAKQHLDALAGRDKKIEWLRQFHGIGPKYSRNMMMDTYQPDFRESIAIDSRIGSVSTKLGLSFANYLETERFYVDAAHDAGIEGWELDRLMYKFTRSFIENI